MPLLNVTLLVHDILVGKAGATQVMVVWAVSLAWAVLGILLATRVFQTEQVLLSGEKPWRDVFASGARSGRGLTPGNALAFAAMLVVLTFYGSVLVERRGGIAALILVSQLGFFLIPSLLWCRMFRAPLAETLQLRWPTQRGWAATVLLAAGGWSVGAVVWQQLLRFPGARAYSDWLGELLGKQGHLGLGTALLLVALLPAIAEEVTFRGVVLAGLRRSGSRWIAIGGSALVFGLVPREPVPRCRGLRGGAAPRMGGPGEREPPSGGPHPPGEQRCAGAARPDSRPGQPLHSPAIAALALASTAVGAFLVRGSRRPTAEPPAD